MGSRFCEEGFGEEKRILATAGFSNSGFFYVLYDRFNTDQMNVELFLVNFENKVILVTILQKTLWKAACMRLCVCARKL